MADPQHLKRLMRGAAVWNEWRNKNPKFKTGERRVDLFNADLSGTNLSGVKLRHAILDEADLSGANLSGADLSSADLVEACLSNANLSGIHFSGAVLTGANLSGADLSFADLDNANLSNANLSGANLSGAELDYANLSGADLSGANLEGCSVYATSAWNVKLTGTIQSNLIITDILSSEPKITVDNLEVAQFIYLLLNHPKIRDVIDTITSKVVLILGRFTSDRKAVLDAIRDELRKRGYVPLLFDFDKPESRDVTETITTLARMARFIIADLTDPRSIPQELAFIIPHLPSVPVQPLLLISQQEYAMYEHFTRYPWVLPIYRYTNLTTLLQSLKENVIDPAEKKAQELAKR